MRKLSNLDMLWKVSIQNFSCIPKGWWVNGRQSIETMWACDMSFHSSLGPYVTWDWVTVWAKLGLGVLLVMNTKSSLTFNTSTMDFLLYTLFHGNPTPSNGRPGCPALRATKNGLVISFSVNFKSGRTADSAKQELVDNPALHEGAEFIIVALGGNDLCPGKIPSDDLDLPEEVANRLWDLYTKLLKNANRVDVCTLITRPEYDQFHQYMWHYEQQNQAIIRW